jgi:glycosyltransferase involved in cell wall biosynthesis
MNSSLSDTLEIILITYNRARYLDATLERLRESPIARCKFTVLDNSSSDATPEVCRKHTPFFPNFHVLRNRFNIGVSGNYLRALELAQSQYAWIICDDDDFDFSHFDEVAQAVASGKYDLISLGVPNHSVLPRGAVIRAAELIRDRRYHFFYTGSFIPCTIFRTSLVVPEMVLKGYYNIHTIFSNLFLLIYAVKQNALVYVTTHDFIINRQENVGYRPLLLVIGWMIVANEVKKDDKTIARAMMREIAYPKKLFQYSVFQRGFVNQNTFHDAFRVAVEALKAGPVWFLKVLPFVLLVTCLPGFVSRLLWRGAEKLVEAREGRKIKRPENIEFLHGKKYRG